MRLRSGTTKKRTQDATEGLTISSTSNKTSDSRKKRRLSDRRKKRRLSERRKKRLCRQPPSSGDDWLRRVEMGAADEMGATDEMGAADGLMILSMGSENNMSPNVECGVEYGRVDTLPVEEDVEGEEREVGTKSHVRDEGMGDDDVSK